MRRWLFACTLWWGCASPGKAEALRIEPYLQDARPDSIWIMWESFTGSPSTVYWGPTAELGEHSAGVAVEMDTVYSLHQVQLTGLSSGTRYQYRVPTSDGFTEIHDFVTPPEASDEADFNLIAMSDMQIDGSNPEVFGELVNDGIITVVEDEWGGDLASDLGLVLVPGDLVENGTTRSQWAEDFFGPAANLLSHVPVYPVYGNHERDTSYFADYFQLPDNGSTGFEDHWWHMDYSNVRVIGLDSNTGYRTDLQLDWLSGVLDEACDEDSVDFVFAELHHPHLSELWVPGETGFTGDVIALLEDFTNACGKPSIHFFGHTHGYSRGQSRDDRHLWVNVATAGGNIDYWGEYEQNDYDEFTVTQDEWGFVLLEVTAGEDPSFRLERRSRGDEFVALDNTVRDEILIRRYAHPPETPSPLHPSGEDIDPNCVQLEAADFESPDGNTHGASQWQLSASCDDFSDLLIDRWVQHENWYGDADTQAGVVLTNERAKGLAANTDYCWRVRYRDQGLTWSDWSIPTAFRTGTSVYPNRIENGDAEDSIRGWTAVDGPFEALTDGECGSGSPHSGAFFFAVGGVCGGEVAYGEAHQDMDISDLSEAVSGGTQVAVLSAFLADWSGSDLPGIRIDMLDADGVEVATSETRTHASSVWTEVEISAPIPSDTTTLRVVLMGTRYSGTDNDSYFDDITLQVLGEDTVDACDLLESDEGSTDTGAPPDEPGEDPWDTGVPEDPAETDPATPSDTGGPEIDDEVTGTDETGAAAVGSKPSGEGCGCAVSDPSTTQWPWWGISVFAFVRRRKSEAAVRLSQACCFRGKAC
jgi:hypothetical protein